MTGAGTASPRGSRRSVAVGQGRGRGRGREGSSGARALRRSCPGASVPARARQRQTGVRQLTGMVARSVGMFCNDRR